MNRRELIKTTAMGVGGLTTIRCFSAEKNSEAGGSRVYLTNGLRINEVTENSVIIWTRLCKYAKPNPVIHARCEKVPYRYPLDYDEDMPVEKMDGEVIGIAGKARVTLVKPSGSEIKSEWKGAESDRDYTLFFEFNQLEPSTQYKVCIEAMPNGNDSKTIFWGQFKTAPESDKSMPILFTSASDQLFWDWDDDQRGFKIYDCMRELKPVFFVHNGDFVYYDKPGPQSTTVDKARHKWHRVTALPSLVDFYRKVPCYMEKDDHDTLRDDSHPYIDSWGKFNFQEGLSVWRENVPIKDKPYRTFRWGKDLQIWLTEGREFRSDNSIPDSDKKTILGEIQKDWLKKTLEESDATFRILFSPTPIVGPDADWKADNHSNKAFQTEGKWLRKLLAKHNVIVINGDRHWQYVSVDEETGLREYCHGPESDSHAVRGFKRSSKHRFLKTASGGFMSGRVWREEGVPRIEFIFYDVNGKIVYKEGRSF
jgi:alkaline phosphatase D